MNEHYMHNEEITRTILNDTSGHRMHIAYAESDGYCPRFGYSIGLFKEFNHPELIVLGLNPDSSGSLLNSFCQKTPNLIEKYGIDEIN